MSRFKTYFAEVRPTLTLAVPIIVGQVSQMLMGVTDSVMIGQTGTVPLAASSFAGNVFSVFYVIGIGLMIPVAIFVARARGAGSPEECGEYLRHGLVLALGAGVVETLAVGVLGAQLHWFGQPLEVLVYLALRQFAEAMGRPWSPMFIMLGSVALNAGLNWVLIYGNLGAPALGLTGAGISTLVARAVAALGIFLWLRRDPAMRPAWPKRWWAPLERARLREMLKLGLPTAGILFFESGAFAAAAIMMGWLGAAPLAAHQIAISCVSTTFMVLLGLSMASGMRISAAVGAKEPARLRPIGVSSMALGAIVATVFMGGYLVAGRAVASWFVPDAAVVALATQLLVVAALFQFFDGAQVIGSALLRGLTDVKLPAIITFVAYWLVAIPGGYLLGVHGPFGAVGIWASLAAGLGFAAVFLGWRFVRLTRLR